MEEIQTESERPGDLRAALAVSEKYGDLIRIKRPVNINLELVGEYLKHAGGTPMPQPTRIGPVVVFENVMRTTSSGDVSYDIPVAVGVVASRDRVARFFGVPKRRIPFRMMEAMRNPTPIRIVSEAPCQEVVIRDHINLMEQLPIPTMSYDSAGPTITSGLLRGIDPETGLGDVTFHRIFVLGPDRITALMNSTKHIKQMQHKAELKNEPFPVSVNIGFDPFTCISAGIYPPAGADLDELTVAGSLKGSPVEVVQCRTIAGQALARAEIVLECEMLPNETASEDSVSSKKGESMPEMGGYVGAAAPSQVLKVKAITHRSKPIYQTLVTPGEEHNIIAGVPCEAEILDAAQRTGYSDLLANAYLSSAGGGKLLAVLQMRKQSPADDAEVRNVAMLAMTTMHEMKNVIAVDDDVDIWDPMDLWWAFTTRFRPREDMVVIDGARSWPGLAPYVQTTKAIFDFTVPWSQRTKMRRPRYMAGVQDKK